MSDVQEIRKEVEPVLLAGETTSRCLWGIFIVSNGKCVGFNTKGYTIRIGDRVVSRGIWYIPKGSTGTVVEIEMNTLSPGDLINVLFDGATIRAYVIPDDILPKSV
ncbi:hypothetical protein IPJ70_03215 [Candidatus Campbellbacteria bacterium]|nr:MAG: hypothetical protein IPJ70_03215 [Candidatus Campbellbacteria bacterium]